MEDIQEHIQSAQMDLLGLEQKLIDHHSFHFTPQQILEIFAQPLYQHIISSAAFSRLKDVRFLGAIDYVLFPDNLPKARRHTRYDHSLGVGRLAINYASEVELDGNETQSFVVAALLHDIGHGPLSHSMEPAFSGAFGLDHHSVAKRIIRGEIPLGADLFRVLRTAGVDLNGIEALISGGRSGVLSELLIGPINLDTVEGIFRCCSYFLDQPAQRSVDRVVSALVRLGPQDIEVLDHFWMLKGVVYNQLVQSDLGVVADYICRTYLEQRPEAFQGGLVFVRSESDLRKLHPKLFDELSELRKAVLHGEAISKNISFTRRIFEIDSSEIPSNIFSLRHRYIQRRVPAALPDRRQ